MDALAIVASVAALQVGLFFALRSVIRKEFRQFKPFSAHEVKVLSEDSGHARCDYCGNMVVKHRISKEDASKTACLNCQQDRGL